MSDISLSKAVRSNLLSLQNTADMMSATQNRLATGKKVNSALDNPSNFFTASSLNSRAGDMNQLLDGMANGIQTLEAADNGLKAITKTLESMQSTLRQARQDKSFQTASYEINLGDDPAGTETLSLSGGALAAYTSFSLTSEVTENTAASITAGTFGDVDFTNDGTDDGSISFNLIVDGETHAITLDESTQVGGASAWADASAATADEIAAAINEQVGADVASVNEDGDLVFTSTTAGTASTVEITDLAAVGASTTSGIADAAEVAGEANVGTGEFAAKSVDALVQEINTALAGQVRASNDNGKLRIENQSTQDLTVGGVGGGQITGGASEAEIGGNSVRAGLADQFRELRDQLDKLADDASFNGINLLRGDNLQITFNETGTSELNIRSKDGESINSGTLKIETNMQAADLDSDTAIDGFLGEVKEAINTVRSQSSAFGSSLSIVQNRQDFSKNMINTLQTGAANLTLADSNEEAANLLALQTRQQLSSTALSMASQADQAVLRLF
jgi:flagellin